MGGSQSGTSDTADMAEVCTAPHSPRCIMPWSTPTDTPWSTPRGPAERIPTPRQEPPLILTTAPRQPVVPAQATGAPPPPPRPAPSATFLATAPTSAHCPWRSREASSKTVRDSQGLEQTGAARSIAWYRVAFCGGISVRERASASAPTTGFVLPYGVVFGVAAAVRANDCRLYLKLSCGRGWVFDDSFLMPRDPSVVFVRAGDDEHVLNRDIAEHHTSLRQAAWQHMYGDSSVNAQYYQENAHEELPSRRYLTRGCRGGARRNKNKKRLEAEPAAR